MIGVLLTRSGMNHIKCFESILLVHAFCFKYILKISYSLSQLSVFLINVFKIQNNAQTNISLVKISN